jgi:hypothetical protein
MSQKLKFELHKIYYVPILTHEAETRTWTEKDVRRLQAEEMKFLQNIRKP